MAVALKSRSFQNPQELTKFCADAANGVVEGKFWIVPNPSTNVFTLFWI